jgi:hypothetical protein
MIQSLNTEIDAMLSNHTAFGKFFSGAPKVYSFHQMLRLRLAWKKEEANLSIHRRNQHCIEVLRQSMQSRKAWSSGDLKDAIT